MQLNRRILECRSAEEVCQLVEAHGAEFDHVNVATAYRRVLQSRRGDGGPRGAVEGALRELEASAVRMMDVFEARQIANTL